MTFPSIAGFIIVSKNSGFFWTALSVIFLVGLYLLRINGYFFPISTDAEYLDVYQLNLQIGLIIMISTIFLTYEITKDDMLDRIDEVKKKVSNKNEELQTTNNELIQNIQIAGAIQNNLISSKADLNQSFEENFLLFVPKKMICTSFFYSRKEGKNRYLIIGDTNSNELSSAMITTMIINSIHHSIVSKKNELSFSNSRTNFSIY